MKLWPALLLLSALLATSGEVTLAWDPVDTATGYKVYWGVDSRTYPNVRDVGPATQATIGGLYSTITYFFAVTAYNDFGESDFSSELSVTIPPLPPPEFLAVYPGIFTWSYPVTSDTLAGFTVYRKELGVRGVRQWRLPAPAARALSMPDLRPGSTYQFWVIAYSYYPPLDLDIFSVSSPVLEYLEPLIVFFGDPQLLFPDLMDSGAVRITFYGSINPHVFASSDLVHWSDIGEMDQYVLGRHRFFDTNAVLFTQRFYRVGSESR